MDQRADRIRGFVENNQLPKALDALMDFAREFGSADDLNDVIVLKSELPDLARDKRRGIRAVDDQRRDQRDLKFRVLELYDALGAATPPKPEAVPEPEPVPEAAKGSTRAFQNIIGIDNLKQVAWLAKGLDVSRAVCRVLTPGGSGTGFLISPDRVMTNNHVIPSKHDATKVRIEFNYELRFNGTNEPTVRYRLDPEVFFKTSSKYELDYTVVAVKRDTVPNAVPTEKWGRLLLNPNADPMEGEHVMIVQHPNGQPKQIALTANSVMKVDGQKLHYSTDTMKGSSGSPVFNSSWEVVALHHVGAPAPDVRTDDGQASHSNVGILMSAILPDLGDKWT